MFVKLTVNFIITVGTHLSSEDKNKNILKTIKTHPSKSFPLIFAECYFSYFNENVIMTLADVYSKKLLSLY